MVLKNDVGNLLGEYKLIIAILVSVSTFYVIKDKPFRRHTPLILASLIMGVIAFYMISTTQQYPQQLNQSPPRRTQPRIQPRPPLPPPPRQTLQTQPQYPSDIDTDSEERSPITQLQGSSTLGEIL